MVTIQKRDTGSQDNNTLQVCTNYVSQFWGGLDPPTPLSDIVSNWLCPYPHLAAIIIIWLPQATYRQFVKSCTYMRLTGRKSSWHPYGDVHSIIFLGHNKSSYKKIQIHNHTTIYSLVTSSVLLYWFGNIICWHSWENFNFWLLNGSMFTQGWP